MASDGTKIETFQCQNCGGSIRFNVQKQQFSCVNCGTTAPEYMTGDPVREHPFEEYSMRERAGETFEKAQDVVCGTCGAHVLFEENQAATICPMCGSSQVAVQKLREGVPPDGVIPFQVDRQQAQQNFKRWVKKRWFAPNRFKEAYQEGKLNGVYLPFWTFDAQARANYSGQGGKNYTVKDKDGKTHTRTNWSFVCGTVAANYDDIQICASDNTAAQVVGKIMPYNTIGNTRSYAPAYLAGFSAERYARRADEAYVEAQARMERDLRSRAESEILSHGYDQARVTGLDVEYRNVRYKNVLLPAWLSAFFYSGKQYLYMINGETGRVGGQRPYSVPKIAAAVALVIAIVLFVYLVSEKADAAGLDNGIYAVSSEEACLVNEDSGQLQEATVYLIDQEKELSYGVVWTGQGYDRMGRVS